MGILGKATEPFTADFGMVDEGVLGVIVRRYKTETLFVVEPFHGALRLRNSLSLHAAQAELGVVGH